MFFLKIVDLETIAVTKLATIYPTKYPPVGPIKTIMPQRAPAKTGSPIMPAKKYAKIVIVEIFTFVKRESNKIKKSCITIGTGLIGRGIEMYAPRMISAKNIAQTEACLTDISLKFFINAVSF